MISILSPPNRVILYYLPICPGFMQSGLTYIKPCSGANNKICRNKVLVAMDKGITLNSGNPKHGGQLRIENLKLRINICPKGLCNIPG
jgi:hypothetical protein